MWTCVPGTTVHSRCWSYPGVRSCARASLAFYNTTADIDRFLAALGGVRKEMGYAE